MEEQYISEKREIQYIYDIDNALNDNEKEIRDLLPLVDDIFSVNESNVNDTHNKIVKSLNNYDYIIKCIEYASKIRPKQQKSYCDLFSLFSKSKKLDFDHYEGVIQTISDDNIDEFVKFTAEHNFDSQEKIKFRTGADNNIVFIGYMQIMAYFGAVKCFKYALMDNSFNKDYISKYAIAGGNNEIIHLLEQNETTFDDCFGVSIKYNRYEISDWLLRNYKCEYISLSDSIKYYNIRAFMFVIKNKMDNKKESFNEALVSTSLVNNLTVSKYLYSIHAMPFYTIEIDNIMLNNACLGNYLRFAQYLVEIRHVDPNKRDFYGNRAIYFAVKGGSMDVIRYLVEKCKVSLEENGRYKQNVLHVACSIGNMEIVKYLVEKCNVSLEEKDSAQKTALHIACSIGNIEIVKYLTEKHHVKIEEKDECLQTVLHIACSIGNFELVKYFTEKYHVKAEEKDRNGDTPLLISCKKGFLEIVRYFVEVLYVSFSDKYIKNSNEEIKNYLFSKNLIHRACNSGDLITIKKVTEDKNIFIDQKYNGKTPLHFACKAGNLEIVKYIVEVCHANINEMDEDQRISPLHMAVINGNLQIVKYLIETCHVNIMVKYDFEITLLHLAVMFQKIEIVKYLINERNFNAKEINFEGRNILHVACTTGSLDNVKFLVENYHINIEQKSLKGETALHIACEGNYLNIVKYLVEECNANIEERDDSGRTPSSIAFKKGNLSILTYLLGDE